MMAAGVSQASRSDVCPVADVGLGTSGVWAGALNVPVVFVWGLLVLGCLWISGWVIGLGKKLGVCFDTSTQKRIASWRYRPIPM